MKKLSNLELLMEYMEQNQYFIGNDLLAKYNELLQKEQNTPCSFRHSYLVKFVDPSKTYTVDYLAPHQSKNNRREEGVFTLKGKDLTEKQILQLFLRENL